jgi:hypothetical protein
MVMDMTMLAIEKGEAVMAGVALPVMLAVVLEVMLWLIPWAGDQMLGMSE